MTARDIAALFDALELDLVKSLHRCLARHQQQEQTEGGKNGTPRHWQAWQAAKLRDLRRFRRENTAILGEYRDRIDADTRTLLEEGAAQGGADGFFRMSDERMTALLNEMQQATDAATRDFLDQGIACIRYRNGRRVNISTYAEMALRTAGTRAMLMGEAAQRERLDLDTVLVSQYGACSKTCLPWQGLVYIDDVFQPYHGTHTPGGTYGVSRNGRQYPLLSVAMQGGLFHPNCRHTLSTWVEGVSTRPHPMDKAKVEAAAQLEAKQRALERSVRKAKRQAAGLCDPAAAKAACARVHAAQKELRDFVADHGDVLRRDVWRERDTAALETKAAFTHPQNNDILYPVKTDGSVEKIEMTFLGNLDPTPFTPVFGSLQTTEVVVTDERIAHIKERHPEDYSLFEQYGREAIFDPDMLVQDMKHVGTVFAIKKLPETNLNVVLRLVLDTDDPNFKNSVMTFYRIRDKNLKKLLDKNPLLYIRE